MDRWMENKNVIKGIALLLAIMLWFLVNQDPSPTAAPRKTTETYRITEVGLSAKLDENRFVVVKKPKTVTVELSGSPTLFNVLDLSPDRYEVYIDLQNVSSAGTYSVPVSYTGFPRDLAVRIIPDEVEVTVEEMQKVEKPVSVQLVGKTPEGYTTGEPIVNPTKVHVTVPQSKAKEIAAVQALVNIEGAKAGIEQTVPLRVIDTKGEIVKVDITPPVVDVTVPVASPFVTVPIKLNFKNQPPAGYSIASVTLKTDQVTVYGPKDVVDGLDFYPGPQIDQSTLTQDRYLQLKIPLLPNVVKTEPDFVEVSINVVQSESRIFEGVPIKVNGLAQGLTAQFVTPENGFLSVTVEGAPNKINEMKDGDIQAYIDVSNLPPGEQEVPVNVNLPSFITMKTDGQPLRAIITIEKIQQ